MKQTPLHQKLLSARERLKALKPLIASLSPARQTTAAEALQELSATLEDLQGAAEELGRRSETVEALKRSHDDLEGRVRKGAVDLDRADAALQAEISEHQRTDAALAEHRAALDAVERQLLESQRFRVLGQITSGVAHEVRNPINAILVMTEALEARLGEASEHAHYLGRIRAQVNRLSKLMQDLLDLGKPLQLSNLECRPLADICASAVALWRQSASGSGQDVRVVQPPGLEDVKVLADVSRLEQVFINLIDNAAQCSPQDSEIVLSVIVPEEDVIRARVTDRGPGIPAENLPQVFVPFFTTRKSGTGLGLSLVKHIVEAHRGGLSVWNNVPPPGCTVEIRLPVAKEAVP